jgi:RHS repeat-associated protein
MSFCAEFVRRSLFGSVLVATCLIATSALEAQDYLTAIGSPTFSTAIPVDNGDINIGNGNLQLAFPIASPTQRGGVLAPNEQLVYDSRIWQIVFNGSTYSWQPTNVPSFSAGWRFITAQSGSVMSVSTTSPCDVYPPRAAWNTTSFSYADPAGAIHEFNVFTERQYTTRQGNACYDSTQPDTPSGNGLAIDGSGYHIYVTNYRAAVVYDRNGGQVYPKVEDANGNYFSKDANGNLIDTQGNTPVLVTASGSTTYYDVLGVNGVRNRYTVTTAPVSVTTAFHQLAVAEWSGTLTAIQSISLPGNQGSYQFSYDPYGEVSSVTLPTGGIVSYGWSNYVDSYQNSNRWLNSLTKDGGTSSYTPAIVTQCSSGGTGCVEQVTVTTPAPTANDTVYKLILNNGSWNSEIDQYSGSSASGRTLLHVNSTTYDFSNQCDPTLCIGSKYIRATTSTTRLPDVGLSRSESYTYDSPTTGNLTADKVYDFYSGSSLPAQPSQETDYVYGYTGTNAQPSLTSTTLVSYATGGPVTMSQTTQNFDQSGLVSTSSLPNHEILSGTKANLTSISQWLNTGGASLTTNYILDDAGMRRSSTDPKGTTSYGYNSTGTFVTSTILPRASSNVTLSMSAAVDSSTGVPVSETDANGTVTSFFSYDALNRPGETDVRDSSGNLLAKTTIVYTPTQTSRHVYQSTSSYQDTETLYDAYGRVSRTALSNGRSNDPWYQQDTCYDSNGRVSTVSTPYVGTGWGTSKQCSGTQSTYDGLGRQLISSNADGPATYSYRGRAVQTTDVNGVRRISQVDGFNRISAVCEVSSNSSMPGSGAPANCGMDFAGTGFLTTYSYDDGNHKTTVNQGVQQRIFQTDSLNRTTQTLEPERGTATYNYTYNSTGLSVVRVRPQANQTNAAVMTTTTTQYDTLGRVVSVQYTDGTPTKSFSYDTYNGSTLGASLGYLTIANTSSGGNTIDQKAFYYGGMGRLSQTAECLSSWCSPSGSQNVDRWYNYDLASELSQEQYSTVLGGGSPVAINYSYNVAGQLTSVQGGQGSGINGTTPYSTDPTTMTPFGPVLAETSNGLSVSSTYDSLGRLNGRWVCNQSTQAGCTGGTQLYGFVDSTVGNEVTSMTDTVINEGVNFGYDEFGRLTRQTHTNGAVNTSLSFTYDRYGNRWQQNVTAGSGPQPQLTFNTSSNHVGGYQYDADGNVTNDSSHTYRYDGENNLISVDGGSTATFSYNAMNERVEVTSAQGTERYSFDLNSRRSTAWNNSGGLDSTQYYAGNNPVAYWLAAGGNIHFQYQDWLGTERLRATATGSVEGSYSSLPFGDSLTTSGTDTNVSHFALLDHDLTTGSGLEHADFREYGATAAQWLSPDPYGGSYNYGNPQSMNRYAYTMNNPVSFVDPSGKDPYLLMTVYVLAFNPFTIPFDVVLGGVLGLADVLGIEALFFPKPVFHGSLRPRPRAPNTNPKTCSVLQRTAAVVGKQYSSASSYAAWVATGAGAVAVVSTVGEGPSLGSDTPVTITAGTVAAFFAEGSFVTGAAGAAATSFAAGNLASLTGFGWGQLSSFAASGIASKIPLISRWSGTVGDLTGQASDLADNAPEVCP